MITSDITHVSDIATTYGNITLPSKEDIEVLVCNSQAIEGYKPASKEYEDTVEAFMSKHNVKVSD